MLAIFIALSFSCMNFQNRGYINGVDQLIEDTSLTQVLSFFGQKLPERSSGEHRMKCVFEADGVDSTYGTLTVRLDDVAKRIYCHSCGVRGNLLTLVHGLKHKSPPTGGRLRGSEFKDAVETLKGIHGGERTEQPSNVTEPVAIEKKPAEPPPVNIPLKDQEKTEGLVDLFEDLKSDPVEMPPEAAAYFRARPWLTPDVCRKWKMGYLSRSGRSLLRGLIVYAHQNERGDIISYSGRDVRFDEKWMKWEKSGRVEEKRPAKHRYVKGYHKGLELYGQNAGRLQEPQLKESLATTGLVVVEGQNDVIRLDCLGVAAVGLCMNKATEAQIEKIERFSRSVAGGKIVLLPDNDEEGEAGFKELAWQLLSRGLHVRLGWSRQSHGGKFNGMQPEEISEEMWKAISPVM